MWSWLGMFVGSFALDFVWTKTVYAVAHEGAIKAATWGMTATVIGDILILCLVADAWTIIPGAAGAWLGVFIPKYLEEKKKWQTNT
jgi:hypothetical protein